MNQPLGLGSRGCALRSEFPVSPIEVCRERLLRGDKNRHSC